MFFRHFKGKFYQFVGEAHDTSTEGRVIVYRTLYESGSELFTRPYAEFFGNKELEDGTVVKRFAQVAVETLPSDALRFVRSQLELRLE